MKNTKLLNFFNSKAQWFCCFRI